MTATMPERQDYTCPRCLGQIPNNENPGAYPGALSRITRDEASVAKYGRLEVCSECGRDEAFRALVGPESWPILTSTTPVKELTESRDQVYRLQPLIDR